jgi:FAD/FMN-containing dehydrogenase/Fe-S oxidoreductase
VDGGDGLRQALLGELRWDEASRRLFACDASPYRVLPAAVAFPTGREDCIALVRHALRHRQPLIPRGAGTGLAGQCVGSGIVVDLRRHMHRLLALDLAHGRAEVEPGITLATLNQGLAAHRLYFPPDPSTASRCTLGGMFGNNAAGHHALRDGTTRDHVEEVEAILADGSLVRFGPLSTTELRERQARPGREGEIHRRLLALLAAERGEIQARYDRLRGVPNNCGYPLDLLLRQRPFAPAGPPFNLAPFLAGSEGTLVLATRLRLRLARIPAPGLLLVAHFRRLSQAIAAARVAVDGAAGCRPVAVELLDDKILALARRAGSAATAQTPGLGLALAALAGVGDGQPEAIPGAIPKAILLVECPGEGQAARSLAQALQTALLAEGGAYACPLQDGATAAAFWALRRAGLGLLMGWPGRRRPVTGVEDTAVPLAALAEYAAEVRRLCRREGVELVIYGAAGRGALHFRPLLDLQEAAGRACFERLMAGIGALAVRYGGTVAAKHGVGRLRAHQVESVLGPQVVESLREVKRIFDPEGLLNPGKVVDAPPWLADLRPPLPPPLGSGMESDGVSREGPAFASVARCHGAGACIAPAPAVCPTFLATGEEGLSPRGRAALAQAVWSQGHAAVDDPALVDSLAQCLGCKSCRSGCPAGVDIARLRDAVAATYLARQGIPWATRTRVWSILPALLPLAGRFPRIANAALRGPGLRQLLGLHQEVALPILAAQPFSPRAQAGIAPTPPVQGRVVLLLDTFTVHCEPEIPQAAVECLGRLGYRVEAVSCLPPLRLLLSLGLAEYAARLGRAWGARLREWAQRGEVLLGLEPAEILLWRDEAREWGWEGEGEARIWLLEEFLLQPGPAGRLRAALAAAGRARGEGGASPQRILLHPHCHARAAGGEATGEALLSELFRLAGMSRLAGVGTAAGAAGAGTAAGASSGVALSTARCCGGAGLFGYRAETYALSRQIAEAGIWRELRAQLLAHPGGTVAVAAGFSCRAQIRAGGGVAIHPAILLQRHLAPRPDPP